MSFALSELFHDLVLALSLHDTPGQLKLEVLRPAIKATGDLMRHAHTCSTLRTAPSTFLLQHTQFCSCLVSTLRFHCDQSRSRWHASRDSVIRLPGEMGIISPLELVSDRTKLILSRSKEVPSGLEG